MAERKKHSSTKSILNLLLLVPNLITLLDNATTIVKIEAKLLTKKMANLLILAVIFSCLIVATWISFLALLITIFLKFELNLINIAFIIIVLNVFFLIIIGIIAAKTRKKLFFPETIKYLQRIKDNF